MRLDNTVELLGYYGSDEIIACSAWTSTSRKLTDDKRGRIDKMIHKLWEEGHTTPFEKGIVHFLVNTDIATHIHLLKHRISSLNGESGRYKELKDDKYYIPEDWEGIGISIQTMEKLGDQHYDWYPGSTWDKALESYTALGNELYHAAIKELEPMLGRKRAKESARYFKGYNMQYEADVMFNLRSFANLQRLRNSGHAQKEIREVSQQMLELVKSIEGNPFKETLKAMGL